MDHIKWITFDVLDGSYQTDHMICQTNNIRPTEGEEWIAFNISDRRSESYLIYQINYIRPEEWITFIISDQRSGVNYIKSLYAVDKLRTMKKNIILLFQK